MKELFLKRMQDYLQDEYDDYVKTLEENAFRGLRINTTKISVNDFQTLNICDLKPSPICPESFYIPNDLHGLGNHPAHLAGLFYMQEPSASSAVEVLDVQPGDWVLDLCAAPGGKSTQIAAKLNHTGFLISNEIEMKRAAVLMSNMERLGFSECMITNGHPKDLCAQTAGWFDKVLVDAPCSGEGMFKKHSKAMEDWSEEHVQACAQRQLQILDSAYQTLKQDGILVYSTCTYAMEENEQVIWKFLKEHDDMELVDAGVSFGRPGIPYEDLEVSKVRRILPMDQGEGHFVAKLKKHGESREARRKELKNDRLPDYVEDFLKNQLGTLPPYHMIQQDRVYVKQTPFVKLDKVRILRQGTLVGDMVKNRIEPHQHLYVSTVYEKQLKAVYEMSHEECQQYLRGNILQVQGYKGYAAVSWHGHPIGFAKGDGMVLKNKYPKGLRIRGL